MTKHCPKCDTTKPAEEFYRNSSAPDGLQGYCKPCFKALIKERNEADPAKRRQQDLESFRRHRETRLAARRESRKARKDD